MLRHNCYWHPARIATHSDSVVDLENGVLHEIAYKRVGICDQCAIERAVVSTSRVQALEVASE